MRDSVGIVQDDDLHVDESDGMRPTTCRSTMTQRVDSRRKEVAVGFLVHTCATSRSKVITYSYAVRPVVGISL